MKTIVIYHRADFDGLFSREIARQAFGETAEYIGWDYGEPVPEVHIAATLYMIDISVDGLMQHPGLVWIDHHKSAIEKYPETIPGYRIDGVAACRLAWQWFNKPNGFALPTKAQYYDRTVEEPHAVRLAGEYDIWDKRDPDTDLFQHALRSCELTPALWQELLTAGKRSAVVLSLLKDGRAVAYAQGKQNESIIKHNGFTVNFEGRCFLACNHARYNSHLFTAGLKPEHEGCLGFGYDGQGQWRISLYGVPGKPEIDFSPIAVKYGGGGHRQACGFKCKTLPFAI